MTTAPAKPAAAPGRRPQRIGAWPTWLRAWAVVLVVVAAGHDFIGGGFFEQAFAWLLAVPMLVLIPLLTVCVFGLLLGLIGGSQRR